MKKILITLVALIPVLGFAQTSQRVSAQRQVAQTNNQVAVEKTAATQVQATPVVLTEEQEHADWLKNNTQFQTMSKAELTNIIQRLDQKLAQNANSPATAVADLKREIKWMNEILSAK